MLRIALVVALSCVALALLWTAGELHRENCQHAGKVACSVLPWESGRYDRQPARITQPDYSRAVIGP